MDIDKIRKALAAAYEAGWRGSIELKDSVVEEIIKEEFPHGTVNHRNDAVDTIGYTIVDLNTVNGLVTSSITESEWTISTDF